MIDLDGLEKLAKAATPGPWIGERDGDSSPGGSIVNRALTAEEFNDKWCVAEAYNDDNWRYIAAFNPQTAQALITRVQTAEAERDEALVRANLSAEMSGALIIEAIGRDEIDARFGAGKPIYRNEAITVLRELKSRAEASEARASQLAESLAKLTEAASKIKHWHDCMYNKTTGETEGMVVSASHVRALWEVLALTGPQSAVASADAVAQTRKPRAVDYLDADHTPLSGPEAPTRRLAVAQTRTPGTVEICERHATGHDCKGEMDEETGRVDKPCSFYLCPLRTQAKE